MSETAEVTITETPVSVTITGDTPDITINDGTPQITIYDHSTSVTTTIVAAPEVTIEADTTVNLTVDQQPVVVVNTGAGTPYDESTLLSMLAGKLTFDELGVVLQGDITNDRDMWSRIGNEIVLLYQDGVDITTSSQVYTDGKVVTSVAEVHVTITGETDAKLTVIEQTATVIDQRVTDLQQDTDGNFVVTQTQITQNATGITSTVTRLDSLDGPTGLVTQHTSQISQNDSAITLEITNRESLGTTVDTHHAEIVLNTTDIGLQVSQINTIANRMDTAETNISANSIVNSVNSTLLGTHEYSIEAVETLLANRWALNISEDAGGNEYSTGFQLMLHPVWLVNNAYIIDDTIFYDEKVYVCILGHTATTDNNPDGINGATYWSEIVGGVHSEFVVEAEKFQVSIPTESAPVAVFTVSGSTVRINGTLITDSLEALTAYIEMSIQSTNYVQGVSGWKIDKNGDFDIYGGTATFGEGVLPITSTVALKNGTAYTTITGNTVKKTSGDNLWDADVYSLNSFIGGAVLRFQSMTTTEPLMVGINPDPETDHSHTSIDYCFYMRSDSTISIYESGVNIIALGAYTIDTIFEIKYDGSNIIYFVDGAVKRIVTGVGFGLEFFIDSSLYIDAEFRILSFEPYADATPNLPSDINLVGYWSLDEGSGTEVKDSSPENNHGAPVNSPLWESGVSGLQLNFDGVNQYINIPDSASLNFGTGDFTISMWLTPDLIDANRSIFSKVVSWAVGGTTAGVYIGIAGSRLDFETRDGSNRNNFTSSVITQDETIHVVFVRKSGEYRKIFINGREDTIDTSANSVDVSSAVDLRIGYDNNTARLFNGGIDEIRIYKGQALSEQEIKALFLNPGGMKAPVPGADISPQLPPDENLAGYWSLDEGSGLKVKDISKNSNDGTLINLPSWVEGVSGAALEFDGLNTTDRYVTMGITSDLDSNEITVCAWIYPYSFTSDGTNYHGFITKFDTVSNLGYLLESYAGGILRWWTDGNTRVDSYAGALVINQWQHVAVTHSSNNTVTLYVNGIEVNSSGSVSGSTITSAGVDFKIGRLYSGTGSNYFHGKVDEIRVYTSVLTVNEIKALYLNPGGLKSPLPGATNDSFLSEGYTTIVGDKISVFSNYITVEAGVNDKLDWIENTTTEVATLTASTSYTPTTLAAHIQTIMRAQGDNDTTVTYDTSTQKITIANSTISTLSLLWNTGTNADKSCGNVLGFNTASNDTGSLTYIADTETALRVLMGDLS